MSEATKPLAVGHIPSGLFIVCARNNETNMIDGFLGSWVQQVSFDPLLVSICIKPGRPAYDLIKNGETFSMNIVGQHEKSYMRHFWTGYNPDHNPFLEIPHHIREDGTVVLDQAKSALICRIKESTHPGDHDLIVAEVLESVIVDEVDEPIVHIRSTGMEY